MASRLLINLMVLFWFAAHSAPFFVATNGNDGNPGTISQPFLTITAARNAARPLGTNSTRSIFIRGGKYYNVAVDLTKYGDDSNLTIQGYPGETAIIYGGMPLTNWVSVSNGWYAAALPVFPTNTVSAASALLDWQVRMLLVDGVMATRAQYPTNRSSLYYTNSNGAYVLGYTNGDLGSWLVVTNAEFQLDYSWSSSLVGCASINTGNNTVTFLTAPQYGLPYASDVKTYRVFNIAQGMSRPGQFFYDRSSRSVVYWPLTGQDPNAVECIVPTTTRIFYINGGEFARPWGITFSNLTLAVGTSELASEGDDGSAVTSGLVVSLQSQGVTLDTLHMGPTAGNAVYNRSANNTNGHIQNCVISWCGSSGIQDGSVGTVISNNLINHIGILTPGSTGIYAGSSSILSHNTVLDCQMSAITSSYIYNTVITDNYVSNCMQQLRDYGAIYIYIGSSNVVANNLIEHVIGYVQDGSQALDYYHFGVYFDQYIGSCTVTNNVFRDCPRPLMLHITTNNFIANNFFLQASNYIELDFRGNQPLDNVFTKNILYSPTNLYAQNYQYPDSVDNYNAVLDWRSNIFYSVIGKATGGTNAIDAETGVFGIPTNSITSDPKFTSLSSLVFSFQPSSPAPGLSILPIDMTYVGHYRGLTLSPGTAAIGTATFY